MKHARVREIIDAYGADAQRWPDNERAGAITLCIADPALAAHRAEAEMLDRALASHPFVPAGRVEALLPLVQNRVTGGADSSTNAVSGAVDRLLAWLFPEKLADFWHPALAALVPVVVGAYFGASGVIGEVQTDWSSSEQYLFAPYALETFELEVEQ